MPTLAKICGLNTPEALSAALDGGAAYVGFVLFARSPRHVAPQAAAELAAMARQRSGARVVALMVEPTDEEVESAVRILAPDLIQLHGAETPARAAAIRAAAGAPTIKAVGVREAADVRRALDYRDAADHLMFDAKPPEGAERPGGHGAAFDWTLLKDVRLARPWFLAGGLDPWNVAEAARLSGAPLVDVSSGVERGPGVKDPGLIAAFLDAVSRA